MSKANRIPEYFLFDIYVAILKIEKISENFDTPESLANNFIYWDSVIREFEIIGEASKHLINEVMLEENYRVAVDFRNLLIHEYFGIDPEEVWNIIKDDLPNFKHVIVNAIKKIDFNIKKQLADAYIEMNKHLDFVVNALKKI